MKRVPAKHTKKAIALTDPNPSFVSLVRAGANMTPSWQSSLPKATPRRLP